MIIKSVQPWFSIQEETESNLNFKFYVSKLRNYVYNAKLWILATKKIDMHDIPVCASTQEQYGGPYFSSIVRRCKWSTLSRKIVEIKGNVILCLCSQMQSLVLRYTRKQNKNFFQTCVNLSASLSLHLTVCLKVFASDGVNLNTINWK